MNRREFIKMIPAAALVSAGASIRPEDAEADAQNFANIDKEKWEQILSEMDPDDFKYKM